MSKISGLLGLLVGLPLLGGCGAAGAGTSDGVQVVTSFYPLQFVAERVAVKLGESPADAPAPGQK